MTSQRYLQQTLNLEDLAPSALMQVCTFASVLRVGTRAAVLKDELLAWWGDHGQQVLFGDLSFQPDDFSDEEDGNEKDEMEQTVDMKKDSQKDELGVLDMCITSCQKTALIEKELAQMEEDQTFAGCAEDGPEDGQSEEEPEEEEPEAEVTKTKISADSVFTLAHVLQEAGFSDSTYYVPAEKDSESHPLVRARRLIAPMQSLTAMVRVNEGILSRPSVLGCKKKAHLKNQMEHALALARRTFQCTAERQSRHSLWQGFTDKFVQQVNDTTKAKENGAETKGTQAEKILALGPSASFLQNGERKYQLLVVRPTLAGDGCAGLRFGIPVAVWRCGKSLKSTSKHEKIVPGANISMAFVTSVHVALLMPSKVAGPHGTVSQQLIGTFLGSQ